MCEIVRNVSPELLREEGSGGRIYATHGKVVGPWPDSELGESTGVPDAAFEANYTLLCRHMLPSSERGNWWGEWERLAVRAYEGIRFDPRDTQFKFLARR